MNAIQIIKNGIVKENPTFVLMLGMCPTLATTTSAINGMSMGLATMAVLICTNVVISCLKSITPDKVRIPVFIVVIAAFVRHRRSPRIVYPTDCGQLYHPRTCRSLRSQAVAYSLSFRWNRYRSWIHPRTDAAGYLSRVVGQWLCLRTHAAARDL